MVSHWSEDLKWLESAPVRWLLLCWVVPTGQLVPWIMFGIFSLQACNPESFFMLWYIQDCKHQGASVVFTKVVFNSLGFCFSLICLQIYPKKSTPASRSCVAVWSPRSGCSRHQLRSSFGQSWSRSHPLPPQFCQDAWLRHRRTHAVQQNRWQTGVQRQRWESFANQFHLSAMLVMHNEIFQCSSSSSQIFQTPLLT